MRPAHKTICNALALKIAWVLCVLGGDRIAVIALLVVLLLHFWFISNNVFEIGLIGAVVMVGVVMDSVLIRSGILISADNSLWPPLWLICLWGVFATTLDHCMKWFRTHVAAATIVGGVAGTLSYGVGTRLTDFTLKNPLWLALGTIFVAWCVAFPLCLKLADKIRY